MKEIRGYDATEWEIFTWESAKGMPGYAEVKRLGGAGDHGRDVVGLCSAAACEGVWDNIQCKDYEGLLERPSPAGMLERSSSMLSRETSFPPRRCLFAAPKGPTTELRDMLLNPSQFRDEVISTWNTRVAKKVVDNQTHLLEGGLADFVAQYDFSSFGDPRHR